MLLGLYFQVHVELICPSSSQLYNTYCGPKPPLPLREQYYVSCGLEDQQCRERPVIDKWVKGLISPIGRLKRHMHTQFFLQAQVKEYNSLYIFHTDSQGNLSSLDNSLFSLHVKSQTKKTLFQETLFYFFEISKCYSGSLHQESYCSSLPDYFINLIYYFILSFSIMQTPFSLSNLSFIFIIILNPFSSNRIAKSQITRLKSH